MLSFRARDIGLGGAATDGMWSPHNVLDPLTISAIPAWLHYKGSLGMRTRS